MWWCEWWWGAWWGGWLESSWVGEYMHPPHPGVLGMMVGWVWVGGNGWVGMMAVGGVGVV